MPKRPAWSFSALNQYHTCPYQYYRLKVKKDVKDTMGEAALWGNEVHKKLEERLQGKPLPERFKQYESMARPFDRVDGKVFAERKLTLNENMEPTGFFAKDAWCRGIIDVSVLKTHQRSAFVGDWKTGKRKPDSDQLKLFAGLIFAHHPEIDRATTAFIWLKEKTTDREVFTRDQAPAIWDHFNRKLRPLEASFENDKWPKKTSGLCKGWCPVRDCPYWEPRKT